MVGPRDPLADGAVTLIRYGDKAVKGLVTNVTQVEFVMNKVFPP